MKVLFTGGSSFTGYWFMQELVYGRHEVSAVFTRDDATGYGTGVRGQRVNRLVDLCRPAFGCRFGSPAFCELIRNVRPDVLCHHAAAAESYKSPDFDFVGALAANAHNLRGVLAALADVGCGKIVLTGSVFEGGEGAGNDGLAHFSPYGLSKALTAATFQHFCCEFGCTLGKFVIPNPFGPWEEPRFTAYLLRNWLAGDAATVRTPAYVRDNIHASLLAKSYLDFVEQMSDQSRFLKTNPSGYIETQGAFAERVAREMRKRFNLACDLQLMEQTEFPEPRLRINTDPVDGVRLQWDEQSAWDNFADYYQQDAVVSIPSAVR